jgi:hypothetical protein
MNPPVQVTFGHADPTDNPLNINELIDLLNRVVMGEITGSYIPYVVGSATPNVTDQDKAWLKQDTQGRPIALMTFWRGNWRRVYNGMLGEIRGYSGNPKDDFDDTGLGKISEQYDGWALCNGQNGTPDLSDKFILGGHMNDDDTNVGYDDGWQARITGPNGVTANYKTGGRFLETLGYNNLPILSNATGTEAPGLWIRGKEAKEDTAHTDIEVLVDTHFANATSHEVNITPTPYGKSPPDPIWSLSPFVAAGWIIFVGYTA